MCTWTLNKATYRILGVATLSFAKRCAPRDSTVEANRDVYKVIADHRSRRAEVRRLNDYITWQQYKKDEEGQSPETKAGTRTTQRLSNLAMPSSAASIRYPVPNLDEIAGATERQDYQATLDTVAGILGSHNSHVGRSAISIDGWLSSRV